MSPDAVRALALGQLRGMLSAGHDISTAAERVASRLPAGQVKDDMVRAAWAMAGGADPGVALADALPKELAATISGEGGASLTSRIELVSEHLNRTHRLSSRLRSLLWYPFQLGCGATLVFIFVFLLRARAGATSGGSLLVGEPVFALSLATWLQAGCLIGGLLGLTIWALLAARVGRFPGWSTVLPGGRLSRTTRLARLLSTLALILDERSTRSTLGDAVRSAAAADPNTTDGQARAAGSLIDGGVPISRALRSLGVPARETTLLDMGDKAGKLVVALRRAVARLENESAVQAKRLAHATGVVLLFLAGVAILWLWLGQSSVFGFARWRW